MRILILSRSSRLYSTRRLMEATEKRGHTVRVVDDSKCRMQVTDAVPSVWINDKMLTGFDAIIPRIGASRTRYGTAVVRQFEQAGIYTVVSADAINRSRDKLRATQLLAGAGIHMPATAFADSTRDTAGLLKAVGGPPVVVKVTEGTQGAGVVLAETWEAAESVIAALRMVSGNVLVQEFVSEAKGADLRAFVVGGEVVASMMRQAPPGEFRANLHQGATAHAVTLSEEERFSAIKAARTLGLEVAGVDLLRTPSGPLLLEVNSSPGLQGIESTSGRDVAGLIIDHIERQVEAQEVEAPHINEDGDDPSQSR